MTRSVSPIILDGAADGSGMGDLAYDRVYEGETQPDDVYISTDSGIVHVSVANGRVGRFRIVHRCRGNDVASGSGILTAATESDVVVRRAGAWQQTGSGATVAVGVDTAGDRPALVAADPTDHEITRLVDPLHSDEWLTIADVDAPVRAIEGTYIAAGDGCYQFHSDGIDHIGYDDVRDVGMADSLAFAATGAGVFRLPSGPCELAESLTALAVDSADRAVAAGEDGLWRRRHDGSWEFTELEPSIVDVCLGAIPYAVTADGTFMSVSSDDVRTRNLGVPKPNSMAIADSSE